MIVIDSGSKFVGVLIEVYKTMGLNHYTITRVNHKVMPTECFNWYLNRVQQIHVVNCETFQDWHLGIAFVLYGWKFSPVDGTNSIQRYATIGQEFLFTIDLQDDPDPRDKNSSLHDIRHHIEPTPPMLFKQKEILNVLNTNVGNII